MGAPAELLATGDRPAPGGHAGATPAKRPAAQRDRRGLRALASTVRAARSGPSRSAVSAGAAAPGWPDPVLVTRSRPAEAGRYGQVTYGKVTAISEKSS